MGIFRRFRTLAEDRRRRLAANQRDLGATAVEYGLILALFGIGMIGVSSILFGAIRTTMGVQSTNVGNTVAVAVVPPGAPAGGTTCGAGGVWDGTACVAICPPTMWFDASDGGCDPIPTCTGATPIYQPLNNTCVADTSGGGPSTPVGTTCPANGWYNPNTGNCDPKRVCSGSTPNWNSFTNTCQSGAAPAACSGTTPISYTTTAGVTTCISSATCTATTGGSPLRGVVVNSTPPSCVTQTTCQNAGSAWVTSPANACITQFQCTSDMTGVWTPKVGSTNATCTTQSTCEANLANAWVGSPRSCVTSTQCTATSGVAPLNGIWIPGSGSTASRCETQTSCNASGKAWLGGTTKYCVGSGECQASSGTNAQTGIFVSGNPPTCVTATTCAAAGSAWVPGVVGTRACISPSQCTGVMAGIFNPAVGGTAASCTTSTTCNAAGNAWIPGNNRACVDRTACEGTQTGYWTSGSPPTCTNKSSCEASGRAWATTGPAVANRYCISPSSPTTCTNSPVNGVWVAGPPPTCTTQTMCNAAGSAWTASPRACVNQTQCESIPKFWNSSTNPPTCDALTVCNDVRYPRDPDTNTCQANANSCASMSPPRWLNTTPNPDTCEAFGPPQAPTSIDAARGSNGSQLATITFNAPANTGGHPITSYVVQYSTNGGTTWTTYTGTGTPFTSSPAVLRGLADGLTFFQVAAVTSDGQGPWSSSDSATVR